MEQSIAVTASAVLIQSSTLTPAERAELEQYEATFKRAFYEAGCSLRAIHEKRLYREYGTFEEYCETRLSIQRRHGYRLLEAAEVVRILEDVSHGTHPLPENERQARALIPLRADPELMRDAWDEAHHIAAERGERFSARHVEEVVKPLAAPGVYPQEVIPADEPLDAYEETIAATYEPPMSRFNEGMRSSDSAEWYTPAHIIEAARTVLGSIDCDPASSIAAQRTVCAAEWYGLDHPDSRNRDGLARDWYGNVWMNPPYGDVIGEWVARLHHQHRAANVSEALALLPARLDTAWWHDNLASYSFCVLRGRLKFSNAENSAPFPSVVVYLGSAPGVFAHAFRDLGLVYRPA